MSVVISIDFYALWKTTEISSGGFSLSFWLRLGSVGL